MLYKCVDVFSKHLDSLQSDGRLIIFICGKFLSEITKMEQLKEKVKVMNMEMKKTEQYEEMLCEMQADI